MVNYYERRVMRYIDEMKPGDEIFAQELITVLDLRAYTVREVAAVICRKRNDMVGIPCTGNMRRWRKV